MSIQEVTREDMAALLEELGDAVLDSVDLALGERDDAYCETHARYLQDLHRVTQATLARVCSGAPA